MGEKCDDVISQLNKVSKSCTDFFLKCDLLQSIRFFLAVMFAHMLLRAVVLLCVVSALLLVCAGLWLNNSAVIIQRASQQISYEAEVLLSSATTQYRSISGEMDVSSRRAAVIRFLSRELSLKRCARYLQLHHNDISWFNV